MKKTLAEIGGKQISLSNLSKNLYPSYGFTKAEILEYYRKISPYMIPHLENRAVTLKRYPEGVDKDFFFEKRCPRYRPDWLKTARVPQGKNNEMTVCLVNDLHTLIWIENLASIELHVPLACVHSPTTPDSVVFDLDPGIGADVFDCIKVAFILRDLLSELKLEALIKTSGMKGLHMYVPLNNRDISFEDTKQFSRSVAEVLQTNYPDLVTSRMPKEYRRDKVFINWSQNDPSKTMVCVYSLRASSKPFVSFPLSWNELKKLEASHDPERIKVLQDEAIARAEKNGDLFKDLLVKKQKLPKM